MPLESPEEFAKQLTQSLETIRAGLEKGIALAISTPKMTGEGKKSFEQFAKDQAAHIAAGEAFLREDGPKIAKAGFHVLASFFININAIADGVNK